MKKTTAFSNAENSIEKSSIKRPHFAVKICCLKNESEISFTSQLTCYEYARAHMLKKRTMKKKHNRISGFNLETKQ
jgi:hypothetical protein